MSETLTSQQYRETVKPLRNRKREEETVHVQIVHYINQVLPRNLGFHVPNGEKRGKVTAAKLKRMGTRAGVPDYIIPYGFNRVLWLEIKKPGGKLSKVQREYITQLRDYGHTVAIVESVDDVRNAFAAIGLVTKERKV